MHDSLLMWSLPGASEPHFSSEEVLNVCKATFSYVQAMKTAELEQNQLVQQTTLVEEATPCSESHPNARRSLVQALEKTPDIPNELKFFFAYPQEPTHYPLATSPLF